MRWLFCYLLPFCLLLVMFIKQIVYEVKLDESLCDPYFKHTSAFDFLIKMADYVLNVPIMHEEPLLVNPHNDPTLMHAHNHTVIPVHDILCVKCIDIKEHSKDNSASCNERSASKCEQ
ncbi:hypothetical protein AB4K20DRAFT_1984299 [Rhizopus microsporus]